MTISGDGLTFLKSFFSSREFDLIGSLIMAPLRWHERLFGVVLVSEKEFGDHGVEAGRLIDSAQRFEKTIHKNHTGRISVLPEFSPRIPTDLVARVQAEVDEAERTDHRLLCARISVEPVLELLAVKSIDVDTLRFRDDFLRILHSFVHVTGLVTPITASSILLAIRTRHSGDPGFILEHMRTTLADFYDTIPHDRFSESAVYYPDDATTAEAICEQLGIRLPDD